MWIRSLLLLTSGIVVFLAVGCGGRDEYPSRPITLVCPWAAGGGTDRVSRHVAVHLEQELGVPVNVVNATGGKGVTGHSRGIQARPDGYTIAMITLELNMMHWSGLTDLTYKDCTPLMSVNEDYAALFVRTDARWKTLDELEFEIQSKPGKLKASGTASGGAWHLALAGWLLAAEMRADDVTWIASTGAAPSLQELIGGGIDMVCCSLPEARTLLEAGEVRVLGVMSPKRAPGFENVKTFREQGTDWSLGGWRGLAVAKDTPPDIVEVLASAMQRMVDDETKIVTSSESDGMTFSGFMDSQGFDHTSRPRDEFREFLAETDEKLGKLLTSEAMRSVNTDRFSPMVFPNILMGLLGLTLAGVAIQSVVRSRTQESVLDAKSELPEVLTQRGVINFCAIVFLVVAYILFAETIGFVLLASAILMLLLFLLGSKKIISVAIAVILVTVVYQVFANVLRVPLPRGLFDW